MPKFSFFLSLSFLIFSALVKAENPLHFPGLEPNANRGEVQVESRPEDLANEDRWEGVSCNPSFCTFRNKKTSKIHYFEHEQHAETENEKELDKKRDEEVKSSQADFIVETWGNLGHCPPCDQFDRDFKRVFGEEIKAGKVKLVDYNFSREKAKGNKRAPAGGSYPIVRVFKFNKDTQKYEAYKISNRYTNNRPSVSTVQTAIE